MTFNVRQILRTPSQLGSVLLSRRHQLRLSQTAVAAKLGISQNRFSELEAHPNRVTFDRLLALANVLGLELVIQLQEPNDLKSEW